MSVTKPNKRADSYNKSFVIYTYVGYSKKTGIYHGPHYYLTKKEAKKGFESIKKDNELEGYDFLGYVEHVQDIILD